MLQLYKNIKKRRLDLKKTQTDLAKALGYSDKSMIAKIEKGNVDLPQSKILAFAEALDMTPGDLMGLDGVSSELHSSVDSIMDEMAKISKTNISSDDWNRIMATMYRIRKEILKSKTLRNIYISEQEAVLDLKELTQYLKLDIDNYESDIFNDVANSEVLKDFLKSTLDYYKDQAAMKKNFFPLAAHNDNISQEQEELMRQDLDEL